MYWCKLKACAAIVLIGSIACLFAACKPDIKETGAELKYFDIKLFFFNDVGRLNHRNIPVLKTVTHNGISQSKKVLVTNWGRELNLFIDADINKPAWKNSYTITDEGGILIYKAKTTDLHVNEMVIKTEKQQVKWMLIYTRTKNILYQTTEKLTYYPDSLYIIEKDQKVKLMGKNSYRIEGKIRY